MGCTEDMCMNNDFETSPRSDLVPRPSRSSSLLSKSMILDGLRQENYGTSRNPFVNFLTEFKKITPGLCLSAVEMAKIGGLMWRQMNPHQKSQFQTIESKRLNTTRSHIQTRSYHRRHNEKRHRRMRRRSATPYFT